MTAEKLRSLSPCVIEEKNKDGASNPAYAAVASLINAIKEPNIKNIAVTGKYGSGKSSVIGSAFQNLPKVQKTISVSLAMLNTSDEKDKEMHSSSLGETSTPPLLKKVGRKEEETKEEETKSIDNQIECSILQQILCCAHPEDIPKSKYNRLYKVF